MSVETKEKQKEGNSKTKTRKRDWVRIKAGFMRSNFSNVKPYFDMIGLSTHGKSMCGEFNTKTKGWTKEKKELMEIVSQEVLSQMERFLKKESKEMAGTFAQAKTVIINILFHKLKEILISIQRGGESPSFKEIKAVWEMIKTEMGEVTKITKEEGGGNSMSLNDLAKILNENSLDEGVEIPTINVDGREL